MGTHKKEFTQPSRTKQSELAKTDIRNIIRKYRNTGKLPLNPNAAKGPMFGEFHGLPSLQEMTNIVIAANEKFQSLPAQVRKEFDNDPQKLIEFIENVDNRDRAIKMGLIAKPKKPEPTVVDEIKGLREDLKGSKKDTKTAPKGDEK